MSIDDLNQYLQKLLYFDKNLDVKKIDPYMSNGLMVRGKERIEKIGFGVSASIALFEEALKASCDVLITHHSFNIPVINSFDPIFQDRFGFLIKHGLSLFGFHFLLDAHPEIGNNAQILKTLGAELAEPYLHRGSPWGWIGKLPKAQFFDRLKEMLNPLSPRAVFYNFCERKISTIAAVSGKGAPIASDMRELIENNVELFITGEVHEWNRELFREAGISFIGGGHYATEVFGIKALMQEVKHQFPAIETVWLDLPNEV